MTSTSVTAESLRKKLSQLTNTQDSIQTLSYWIIHHKNHYRQIVDSWFDVIKDAKSTHKLALLYLVNDVIQNSKRKGTTVFVDAFKNVLEEAASLCQDDSIKKNVVRLFKIWGERKVYEADFCEKLNAATAVSKKPPKPKVDAKFLEEFQPEEVPEVIEELNSFQDEVEFKFKQLSNLNLDVTSVDTISQLKDRAGGKRFSQQFEDAADKLEEFVVALEKEFKLRNQLVELLEKSEIFYEAQMGEAKIVANAYKNFGTRVTSLKKRLDDYKKVLPETDLSPLPSPASDAPSPGATPPQEMDGVNRDLEDMEVSDEDDEGEQGHIIAAVPTKSHSTFRHSKVAGKKQLESAKSAVKAEKGPATRDKSGGQKISVIASSPSFTSNSPSVGEKIPSLSPNVPVQASFGNEFNFHSSRQAEEPAKNKAPPATQPEYTPSMTTGYKPQETVHHDPAPTRAYPSEDASAYNPPSKTTYVTTQSSSYGSTAAVITQAVPTYNTPVSTTTTYSPKTQSISNAYVPPVPTISTVYTPASTSVASVYSPTTPSIAPVYTPTAPSVGPVYTPPAPSVAPGYTPTAPLISSTYTPTASSAGQGTYVTTMSSAGHAYTATDSSITPAYTSNASSETPTYPAAVSTLSSTYTPAMSPVYSPSVPSNYNSGAPAAPYGSSPTTAYTLSAAPRYNPGDATSYSTSPGSRYNPIVSTDYNQSTSPAVSTPTSPSLTYNPPVASSYDITNASSYNPTYSASYNPGPPINTPQPTYSTSYSNAYADSDTANETCEPLQSAYEYGNVQRAQGSEFKYGPINSQEEEVTRSSTPLRDENSPRLEESVLPVGPVPGVVPIPPAPTAILTPPRIPDASILATDSHSEETPMEECEPYESASPMLAANPMQFLTKLISSRNIVGESSKSSDLLSSLTSFTRKFEELDQSELTLSPPPPPPPAKKPLSKILADVKTPGRRVTSTNAFSRNRSAVDDQVEPDEDLRQVEEDENIDSFDNMKTQKAQQAFGIRSLMSQLTGEKDEDKEAEERHDEPSVHETSEDVTASETEFSHWQDSETGIKSVTTQLSELHKKSLDTISANVLGDSPVTPVAPWISSSQPIKPVLPEPKLPECASPTPPPPPPLPHATQESVSSNKLNTVPPFPLAAMLPPPPPPSAEAPPPPPENSEVKSPSVLSPIKAMPFRRQMSNPSKVSEELPEGIQQIQTVGYGGVLSPNSKVRSIPVVRPLSNPSASHVPAVQPIRPILNRQTRSAQKISIVGQPSYEHPKGSQPVLGQSSRVQGQFPGPPPGPPPPTARQLSGSGIRAPGPPPGPPPVSAKRMPSQDSSGVTTVSQDQQPVGAHDQSSTLPFSSPVPSQSDSTPISHIPSLVSPTTMQHINPASDILSPAKPLKSILKRSLPLTVSNPPSLLDEDLSDPVAAFDGKVTKSPNLISLVDGGGAVRWPVGGNTSPRFYQQTSFGGSRPRSPGSNQYSRSPGRGQESQQFIKLDYGHGKQRSRGTMSIQTLQRERQTYQEKYRPDDVASDHQYEQQAPRQHDRHYRREFRPRGHGPRFGQFRPNFRGRSAHRPRQPFYY